MAKAKKKDEKVTPEDTEQQNTDVDEAYNGAVAEFEAAVVAAREAGLNVRATVTKREENVTKSERF